MQGTDELGGLWRVLGSILSYPIVHTETRPITVTTFIAAGFFVVASLWVSRRLRGVLQRRLFPRLHLDPGIEFSILRFAHYAVLTWASFSASRSCRWISGASRSWQASWASGLASASRT